MADFHFSPRANRAGEINWRQWSERAFREAKEQDKPILLGISAVWCHWCHVMDETTYSDLENIRLINEHFIPVRVDNDERPDVNRRYNLGGWPTTAFLTPGGELLTGGTYFPPDQMRAYLTQVSEAYRESKDAILQRVAEINSKRERALDARAAPNSQLSATMVDNVLAQILANFDRVNGGFGDDQKFPQTEALEFALERYHATRDQSLFPVITTTLTNMATGGLYDQVWGGFFRYSTTRDWSVPHYEKMLEDNARLLALYAHAWQVTGDETYYKTVRSVLAYVDLTLSDHHRGGFYGSQDADETYYTLPREEREKRPAPYIDRRFYTDWNALMVSGYLAAAPLLPGAKGVGGKEAQFALKTLDRLWNEMYREGEGLAHSADENGTPQLFNQLADLARTAAAMLDAYQFSGEPVHLERARTLADLALAVLIDDRTGAFWSEPPAQNKPGLLRVPDKSIGENAAMADVLVRLYRLTGEEQYRTAAEKALVYFTGEYDRYSYMAADYARAVQHVLDEPVSVHIVGGADDPRTHALQHAALVVYAPAKVVQLLDPQRDTARLAQLGYPSNGAPQAFVCVGQTCLPPVDAAEGIKEGIRRLDENH